MLKIRKGYEMLIIFCFFSCAAHPGRVRARAFSLSKEAGFNSCNRWLFLLKKCFGLRCPCSFSSILLRDVTEELPKNFFSSCCLQDLLCFQFVAEILLLWPIFANVRSMPSPCPGLPGFGPGLLPFFFSFALFACFIFSLNSFGSLAKFWEGDGFLSHAALAFLQSFPCSPHFALRLLLAAFGWALHWASIVRLLMMSWRTAWLLRDCGTRRASMLSKRCIHVLDWWLVISWLTSIVSCNIAFGLNARRESSISLHRLSICVACWDAFRYWRIVYINHF